MIALFLALLTTIAGSGNHGASVTREVHVTSKITKAQPKPVATPYTAHPLAG